MYLWWVGSRPTAPTPNLGDQDFLSGLSPLDFDVPTPLLQGNKICNPRQGPLQGAISRSQPDPGFFSRLLLLALLLSHPGLGPAMAEFFLSIYNILEWVSEIQLLYKLDSVRLAICSAIRGGWF
jgi:hypothetical protein